MNKPTWQQGLRGVSRTVLSYALLPNLPFLLAAQFMHVQRSVVNLDYLVWGIASVWLPLPVALAGCIGLMLTDLVLSFCSIYYLDFADAVSSLADVTHLSPWYSILVGAACLGAVCLLSLGITAFGKARRNQASAFQLAALLLLLVFADIGNGSSVLSRRQTVILPVNIAGSTVLISSAQIYGFAQERRHPQKVENVPSATAPLLRSRFDSSEIAGPRENIVLILEESLGLSTDPQLTEAVLAPFGERAISERYKVTMGSVPFHGSTVAAEFRELCGAGLGVRSREAGAGALSGCLPGRLRKAGYQVEAIHGFTSRMFRRDLWYPKLGFDSFLAAEQLGTTLAHCGFAFEGVCDDQIASHIGQQLRTPSSAPRFIYWLTLNSHLPVETSAADKDTFACSSIPSAKEYADVCNLSRVLHWTNAAIARLAADPDLPLTRFIIVGDHAPPFISERKRALYSQYKVPYIELTPRANPTAFPSASREVAKHISGSRHN